MPGLDADPHSAVPADHQRIPDTLHTTDAHFRLFATVTSDSIYRMSADWQRLLFLNGKDFLADTIQPGSTWLDAYIPDSEKALVQAAIDAAIHTRGLFELEHRVIRADGTVGWAFSRALPLLDEHGDILEWFGAASDITARKQAEQQLEALSVSLDTRVAERTRALDEERDAALGRSRMLELLTALTADLPLDLDRVAFIQLIQRQALTLLPAGHAAYWEPRGDLWRMQTYVNEVGHADLMAMMRAGVPLGGIPTLDLPWHSGEALYQEEYPLGFDVDPSLTAHVSSVASLPVGQRGALRGVINFTTFEAHRWSAAERAVLGTLAWALGLMLERGDRVLDLARSNAALRASNEELEAFNYSVSHDLMTPVRHIEGFAALIGQHLDEPEKAQRYLGIVQGGATRMATLIQAMLTLSRTGRQELSVEVVDLGALAEQARLDVLPTITDRAVEWRVGPLPLVWGDHVTLQQLMTNLLENAVKYSRERDPAVIEVWAEEDEQAWTISVRDNGAGFDPRYADKLFGMFQRLHRQEEFPGTGVGLSLVRRIITRHGGTVSAKGEVGQGATFSFTLPRPAV